MGEVHQAPVVAEVRGGKLGKAVEPQAADHQALEMTGEKVGEVEGARFARRESRKRALTGVELVAMSARNALDAFLGQHRIQPAARAAVPVGDEDAPVAAARLVDLLAHRLGNACRIVVQLGRQALHIKMSPTVRAAERNDFARQRAAGDNEGATRIRRRDFRLLCHQAAAAAAAAAAAVRRAAMSALAVSTAMPASRQ